MSWQGQKINKENETSEQVDSLLTLRAAPAQQKAACIPQVLGRMGSFSQWGKLG